ncbi:MAG: hypothetical protein PHR87_04890 [Sulfurospirillaceae bacterium]|nr:hypothetical protein [Sulfurospirillaceae bacterium]
MPQDEDREAWMLHARDTYIDTLKWLKRCLIVQEHENTLKDLLPDQHPLGKYAVTVLDLREFGFSHNNQDTYDKIYQEKAKPFLF